MIKRIVKWFSPVLGVLILGFAGFAGFELDRVYGGHISAAPPELPAHLNEMAILIFSKTNGFREGAAVKASNATLAAIARRRGWSAVLTENGAVFNPDMLRQFTATVWDNTSGDLLTREQRAEFRDYIESGGGFGGIHGAGGDPRYDWRWYVETLIDAQFKGHPLNPQFQRETLRIEDPNDPATRGWAKPGAGLTNGIRSRAAPERMACIYSPRWTSGLTAR
jgi:hypothetical protein